MIGETLSLRDLNRATLARQMLLERESIPVSAAIERLAGMQAQLAIAPYIGLWTRLHDFECDSLATAIEEHSVVKATMMRGTLHLVTARDYLRFRSTLQPILTRGAESITKNRGAAFDGEPVLRAVRDFLVTEPRTFAEISAMLEARFPGTDVGAMRYTARTHLNLVQVPGETRWSFPGNARFMLAEPWIKATGDTGHHLPELIRRYLTAFGPATTADVQAWSGFAKLKDTVEAMRPDLITYRDERKRELFDLPGAPRPDADVPAPVRFLPEYDNLLLAHDNRRRVIADAHKPQVYLPGLRVAATFLVDGLVAGTWKRESTKAGMCIVIEPFAALPAAAAEELADEGRRLASFIEPGAGAHGVRFDPPC